MSQPGLGTCKLGGDLKMSWDSPPGRGKLWNVTGSGLCPQPLLFTFATGPWSTAGCSLPCPGHGGLGAAPPFPASVSPLLVVRKGN